MWYGIYKRKRIPNSIENSLTSYVSEKKSRCFIMYIDSEVEIVCFVLHIFKETANKLHVFYVHKLHILLKDYMRWIKELNNPNVVIIYCFLIWFVYILLCMLKVYKNILCHKPINVYLLRFVKINVNDWS